MKRRKWIRRLAYASIALAMLAVVMSAAVPWIARWQLVVILERQIKGPVEVDRIRFEPGHVEIHGLRLFDGAAPPRCWLQVDKTTLAMTFWKALLGRETPKRVVIDGMVAKFHLDRSIQLTTDFTPWASGFEFPFDQVDIRNARVEICIADQSPFGLDRIDMTIRGPTEAIRAEGCVVTSLGGTWNLTADVNGNTLATTLNVAADDLPISTASLAELPYIRPEFLERFQATGSSTVKIALQKSPGTDLQYRLTAKSRSLSVNLPQENLALTDGECDLVLENGVLTLRDFHGEVMGGRLVVSGGLDARGSVWQGQIEGKMSDVALSRLPSEWNLPSEIEGLAAGNVTLNGTIADSKVVLRGRAKASLSQAKVFGSDVSLAEVNVQLQDLTLENLEDPPKVVGTVEVRAEMDEVDLPQFLTTLPLELRQRVPPVKGQLGLRVGATVPLATISDPASYEMNGRVHSRVLTYDQLVLRDVLVPLEYRHGVLAASPIKAVLGENGVINASTGIPLFADGEITADARWEGIAANEFDGWFPEKVPPVEATLAGSLEARVPIRDWSDPNAWHMDATATSPEIRVDEYLVSDMAAKVALREGELQLTRFRARWRDSAFNVSGAATLASPHAFRSLFQVTDLDLLQSLHVVKIELPVEVNGKATVQGRAQGNLVPLGWKLEGNGRLTESGVGPVKLDSPTFDWRITPDRIEVPKARVGLFSGELEFAASLPLDGTIQGRASGTFRNLSPTSVAELLPSQPLDPQGSASGEFQIVGFENPESMSGTVRFRGLGARLGSASIQQLGGTVKVDHGRIDAEVEGKTFGGQLTLNAGGDLVARSPSIAGSLALKAMDASQLARLLDQPALRPLRAVMDVQMDLSAAAPGFEPKGEGNVILRDISWRGNRISNEVRSRAALTGTALTIQGISMGVAGGTMSGQATLRLDQPGLGTFRVNLQRVRTDRLLAPWAPLADATTVRLNSTVRGQFVPGRVSGLGEVQLSQGEVAGIPIRNVSSAFRGMLDPARGAGEIHMRLNRGDLAGGRVSGEMKVGFGRPISVDGRVHFSGLDLKPLAQAVPNASDRLTGRISGDVTLQGRELRSLRELTGSYRLSLANSPVLQLPILNALADSNGIGSDSRRFTKTELEGRMTRGSIDIDEMTMSASGIHLFVEGSISKRGQLDLDVTADTGELMAVGAVVGLVRPIDLIRRRLIFLKMGGTARTPVVSLDVDRQIQQEVLLFFFPFVIQ